MKLTSLTIVIASILLFGCAKKVEEAPIYEGDTEEIQSNDEYESTVSDPDQYDLENNQISSNFSTFSEEAESYDTDAEDDSSADDEDSYKSSDNEYQSNASYSYKGSPSGNSNCFGSDSFYTCNDLRSGNTYQVSKYGNTTYVNGSNSTTGSTWNQTTNTYGNTSYTTGSDKDGNSWNQTTNHYGDNSYSYNGTDSDGNSFGGTCTYGSCSSY